MIPSNLKVGDTYIDGGRNFRVMAVVDGGAYGAMYTSEQIDKKASKKHEEEVAEIVEKTVDVPFDDMKITELQALAKSLGLPMRGSKSALIERIEAAQ